jgi:hypothetical protein
MTKRQNKAKPKHFLDRDDVLLGVDNIGIGLPDLGLGPRPEDWEDDVAELNKKQQTEEIATVDQIMKYLKFMKYPFHGGEMAKHTWMSLNHVLGVTAWYNRVIMVINPDVAQRMTSIYFPVRGCNFGASITLWERDMSAYYIPLKDKLTSNSDTITVDDFVWHINEVLKTNFSGDTIIKDVMRTALQSSDTIAYITEGGHSRSL